MIHPRYHHQVAVTSESTHRVDPLVVPDMKSRHLGAAVFASAALSCLFGGEVAARQILQVRILIVTSIILS